LDHTQKKSETPTPELPTPQTPEDHEKILEEAFSWAQEMEKPEGWSVLGSGIANVEMWERPCPVGNMVKSVTEFPAATEEVVSKLIDRKFIYEADWSWLRKSMRGLMLK
jgi:hypothetical protein